MGRRGLALLLFAALIFARPSWAAPIHEAAQDGDLDTLQRLLDEGADVNAPDVAGTPLHWGLFSRNPDVLRLLLDRGADPNLEGSLGTPLKSATLQGDVQVVRWLLDAGADPNRGRRGLALHVAARYGRLDLVALLLERGADIEARSPEGHTALHEASHQGQIEAVRLLLEHGAKIDVVTPYGRPALHFAVGGGHDDVAELLRAHGSKPGPIAPVQELLEDADVAAGEVEAERTCFGCHSLTRGRNFMAPPLWDLFGRAIGGLPGFTYSPAMQAQEGVWDVESLNAFIARPAEIVPGTSMAYPGLHDPKRRANLIAYLQSISQ